MQPITVEQRFEAFRELNFTPHAEQEKIARSTKRFRIVRAGRRGGKTSYAAHEALAVAIKKPRSYGWVVGPTYRLADRCFEMIWTAINDNNIPTLEKSRIHRHIRLANGSVIEAVSADDADVLQGVGLDWIVVDEAAQILPFVWHELLRPCLSDRRGWAMFIGTPVGFNFWAEQWEKANSDDLDEDGVNVAQDWEAFTFPSWSNTFSFPGGENDPEIQAARRDADDLRTFLEQYGGIPQLARDIVFPQFRRDVHVRQCQFDPELPVELAIDPGAVNPYAVIALQDHGDYVECIDEYYEVKVLMEEVVANLKQRPWWRKVELGICDNEAPDDIRRWRDPKIGGIPVIGVQKPQVEQRIKLYRKWLRDPIRFDYMLSEKRRKFLEDNNVTAESLGIKKRQELDIRLSQSFTKEELLECTKIFFDPRCTNAIREHMAYKYTKPRKDDINYKETPRAWMDHTSSALGYWFWMRKRFGERKSPESYLEQLNLPDIEKRFMAMDGPETVYDEEPELVAAQGVVRRSPDSYLVKPVIGG